MLVNWCLHYREGNGYRKEATLLARCQTNLALFCQRDAPNCHPPNYPASPLLLMFHPNYSGAPLPHSSNHTEDMTFTFFLFTFQILISSISLTGILTWTAINLTQILYLCQSQSVSLILIRAIVFGLCWRIKLVSKLTVEEPREAWDTKRSSVYN